MKRLKKKNQPPKNKGIEISDFKSEEEMEDIIELNIKSLFETITGKKYSRHERQYVVSKVKGIKNVRGYSRARFDLFVRDKDARDYIIEIKNSKSYYENLQGITQLLFYKELLKNCYDTECKLILISSRDDKFVASIIKRYKLPIKYVILKKDGRLFIAESYEEI